MPPLVYHRTRTGLVLAEHATDESAVQRALELIDPDLILMKEVDEQHRAWAYEVRRWISDDIPTELITLWREGDSADGRPLPLTHSLVDKVNTKRLDARVRAVDADAHNELWKQAASQRTREAAVAVTEERLPYIQRDRVGVSMPRSIP